MEVAMVKRERKWGAVPAYWLGGLTNGPPAAEFCFAFVAEVNFER
jgi:hypothetical protein